MNYDLLLTPFNIKDMRVKNRIVMSPMGTNSAHTDGTIDNDEISYFEERAKGGTGMIIIGCQFLTEKLAQGSMEGYLDDTHVIPKLTDLCESVQRYGAKICAQLSCGTGKNAFANMYDDPPVSASEIPSMFNKDIKCKALTIEEIKEIMNQFEFSSKLLKDAGFDAIEVHAHAGYLVDQFMSEVWNKRTDEYGGSLENRMRFPVEIVKAIRKSVGEKMPILFRISCDHRFEGGRTLNDTLPMLEILEKAGVDAFDIDAGSYESIEYIFPPAYLGDACMDYVCKEVRKTVNVPILNSGNHTCETGLKLIESKDADFVMLGRPLIAEPFFAEKLMQNKIDEIRPCIRCNEDCIGRIIDRLTKISCSVNPRACNENRFKIEQTRNPKNIVVIGGGPAGMEAACTASMRGHFVSLYDKDRELGGQLKSAATPEFKSQLRKLVKWYERQLEINKVKIHLNSEITQDSEVLKSADYIIIATGAISIKPKIKGIEYAIDIIDAHIHPENMKGKDIVYCGGGLSACDSALEACMNGKKASIIEMKDEVAFNDHFINKAALIPMLKKYNVNILTGCTVTEIFSDGVLYKKSDGTSEKIKADSVISAFGMKPNNNFSESIYKKYYLKVRIVGDCNSVGKVGGAVREGFFAASTIS